jgi:rubredoxin
MTYRCDNCNWSGDDPDFSMYSDDLICPICSNAVCSDDDFDNEY